MFSMPPWFDRPLVILAVTLVSLALPALLGERLRRMPKVVETATDFSTTLPAALTLLGLILGFSFSMAVGRYDQRKNYEENEANAIGTEYLRASLIRPADATELRRLLVDYTQFRIQFYRERDQDRINTINIETAKLQNALWQKVVLSSEDRRDPVSALVIAGMNDVLNSQGYTQAAWLNRIPAGAWLLLWLVASTCSLMVGFCENRHSPMPAFVLPIIVAIALFLIADIDSPRRGVIHVAPQNLLALAASFGS
jgi:hypothetical protein